MTTDIIVALIGFVGIGLAYGVLAVVWMEHACRNSGNRFYWTDALCIILMAMALWPVTFIALLIAAIEFRAFYD